MSLTSLVFDGLTLVDASALDTFHQLSRVEPRAGLTFAGFHGASGLALIRRGVANTPDLAGVFSFGTEGDARTFVQFSSAANRETYIATVTAKQQAGRVGTLTFEGRSYSNVAFEDFEPGVDSLYRGGLALPYVLQPTFRFRRLTA